MFTRPSALPLKASCSAELTSIIENEWLPLLRRQYGFRGVNASPALERNVVEGVPKVTFEFARIEAIAA